ncbi:MAG TPA: MaoC family dehydratase N-terminal domain-containing protein [Anaeromyxobacteraceae bacterium]|nr:MaoC family dehydratase N-terminal domain-containing protein [Anaeromyxobacteraceae bacterium]
MTEGIDLTTWVGREERRVDLVSASHLAAWNATLDRDDPFPRDGDPAPPGFHWALFPPLARQSEIGPDGHPRRGGFLPPVPLPRRMWAGSRIRFHRALRVGEPVEQVSVVGKVEEKAGRAGALVFVTVRHAVSGPDGPAVEEEQDLVYRNASPGPGAGATAPEPAPRGAWQRRVEPDPVLLFRYSALTFNAHRIHYDRRYATAAEGYDGLVVHGPLIATLLLDLLRRQMPAAELERFRFRGLRPTFDTSPFTLEGGPGDEPGHVRLWSTDNLGQVGVDAEAWIA